MIIAMIENTINLSNQIKEADVCQICIGCGRCHKIHQDMHVLVNFHYTDSAVSDDNSKVSEEEDVYGIGIDLGTTTIAMSLVDGTGHVLGVFCRENPQTIYGSDVLSRIKAAEDLELAVQLRKKVRVVLEQGCLELLGKLPPYSSVQITLAANTTMSYLLMGWASGELGSAPFAVTHKEPLKLTLAEQAVWGFPPLSAFVGGDILAGIYSTGMYRSDKIRLLIDLGTNGELVLGNCHRMLACSTAAGPAFEGGPCKGIWGADMVHLTTQLLERGIVDETGLLQEPYFETGVTIGAVKVTQEAIRALQLAKAAIAAGVEILLRQYGIEAGQIEQVILAGGLGYFLRPQDAARIGLLPQVLADKAQAGGNTALQGTLLIGRELRRKSSAEVHRELESVDKCVQIIELPENEGFQDIFLKNINFGVES